MWTDKKKSVGAEIAPTLFIIKKSPYIYPFRLVWILVVTSSIFHIRQNLRIIKNLLNKLNSGGDINAK